MSWFSKFATSSVGAKFFMAITGAAMVLWLCGHMVGNLLVFSGPEKLNAYAAFLQGSGNVLWVVRFTMGSIILLHIIWALRLKLLNWAARPVGYARKKNRETGIAATNMLLTGLMVAAFITYHLLHFTLGYTNPDHMGFQDNAGLHDVHRMVVLGFQQPLISGSYILAVILLGLHLSHGVSSLFQSVGARLPKYAPLLDKLGPVVAILFVLGNISMPAAVLAGYIKLGGG